MIEPYILAQRQSLPLEAKVARTKQKIREWHDRWNGDIYVAFSGGKDSTVLLSLVEGLYPAVPAVFCDTGLEFPEIRDFVKTKKNVIWLKPKMSFKEVLRKYGYPVISKEQSKFIYEYRRTKSAKHRDRCWNGNKWGRGKISLKWRFVVSAPFMASHMCCDVMKKRPAMQYEKKSGRKPILGLMAGDSQNRRTRYLQSGCNAFENKRPTSMPLGPWLDRDIWEYIKAEKLPYSKIYDMGEKNTGCMFCMFGCHRDNPNRFQRMKKSHPKQWKYCMEKLGLREVLDYMGIPSQ